MSIPKHDEIRLPALKLLQERGILKLNEFTKLLAEHFHLTEEELNEEYESGNGLVFYDRISWALSYLNMSGLLEKPKRGYYKINDKGIELLKSPSHINKYIDSKLRKRDASKLEKEIKVIDSLSKELTPQENLYNSYVNIRKKAYNEILDTIISKNPYEFEKLVVKLLQRMGYGGEIKDSGMVTQKSNDGGIDGVIKEDVLGLGRISIQAKRYDRKNSVGRKEIQSFVGALAGSQSNKGIFITTSYFTKEAIEYTANVNNSIVILIDGEKLAEYIYDYGLGMQVEETIELKKMDSDFWDAMMDDELSSGQNH